ncbi:MAG: zinc-ribbon domain-containing protein [Erysipelotrichaceae bacterium]|nr:zinc-ribbon domain-containing protein [Erysipelotrichaceae bacterium]
MLPKRKRNIRYNPRYGRQENYDIPATLQRKPYAYTQVSPEVRRQEEKEAKKAKEKPVCPHCGEPVKKSQKYCPACGQVLDEEKE